MQHGLLEHSLLDYDENTSKAQEPAFLIVHSLCICPFKVFLIITWKSIHKFCLCIAYMGWHNGEKIDGGDNRLE